MFHNIAKTVEARFGKKAADSLLVVGFLIWIWGVIIGFKGNFVVGLLALTLMLPPFVFGLVSLVTLGNVNLSADIGTWLFTTTSGAAVGTAFCVVAVGIILWRFPNAINEWAKGKISIK